LDTRGEGTFEIGFLKEGMRYEATHDPKPETILIQGSTVFGYQNKALLVVPVQMVQGDLNVSRTALIDSEAQGNFINKQLIATVELKTEVLYPPLETVRVPPPILNDQSRPDTELSARYTMLPCQALARTSGC
jgi:hypothetical protein